MSELRQTSPPGDTVTSAKDSPSLFGKDPPLVSFSPANFFKKYDTIELSDLRDVGNTNSGKFIPYSKPNSLERSLVASSTERPIENVN